MKITYERVVAEANALYAKGQSPSIENISTSLGLLGFYNEQIAEYLDKWYQETKAFSELTFIKKTARLSDQIVIKNSKLKYTLSMVRAVLESTEDGVLVIDNKGQVLDWNDRFSQIWRRSGASDEVYSNDTNLVDFVFQQLKNPDDLKNELHRLLLSPKSKGKTIPLFFKDGRVFLCKSKFQVLGADLQCRVWKFKDYTTKHFAEQELRVKASALEASFHGICVVDINKDNAPIIYVNSAFKRITGYEEDEILGEAYTVLLGVTPDDTDLKHLTSVVDNRLDRELILQCFRKNNESFWCELHLSPTHDEKGLTWHFVIVISDITQQREIAEAMQQQATHDSLTELPNRFLLHDRASLAIKRAKRGNLKVAMFYLDVDNFKIVNDSLGHKVGDALLKLIASRLKTLLRSSDTLSRVGGDEFIILLPDLGVLHETRVLAKRIINAFSKPFNVEGHTLSVSCSIGISIFPDGAEDLDGLLKGADLSMYSAKEAGRNNYQFYISEMSAKIQRRMAIENQLRHAIERNEFSLAFQPIFDLKSHSIIGRESLLRWNNETLGQVPPSEFIPVAEETGMILDIGLWAMERACLLNAKWVKENKTNSYVSVNLSAVQFSQLDIVDSIKKILDKTKMPPPLLEIELTESLLFNSCTDTFKQLERIRKMGLQLAIDDFGTGFSNISYLKKFTVNKLKIDKSFITNLSDNNDKTIVLAIINLAHSLNMTIVAEGIENPKQLDFLIQHNCDYGQGFYLAGPS